MIIGTLLSPRELRPGISAANMGMPEDPLSSDSDGANGFAACDSRSPRMEMFLRAMGRPSMPAHSIGDGCRDSNLSPSWAIRAEFAIV